MTKRSKRNSTPGAANRPAAPEPDTITDEAVVDLPDREVMSLLPSNVGSLSGMGGLGGGGLGGSLLGGGGTTPTATAPPLPGGLPGTGVPIPNEPMTGATQTSPIAQSNATS